MSILPTLRAQLRRRILLSYRVDPTVAASLVPPPFRPQLVDGSAVAGVCLIGLRDVRPGWIAPRVGFTTENAAHRIAVEWDDDGETRSGVYIVERHSSSMLSVFGGGRLFPGVQQRARFDLEESADRFRVAMTSSNTRVTVDVSVADRWSSSLFPTLEDASEFYRSGAVGWSPRGDGQGVEAIELTSAAWGVEPATVHGVESSYFDGLPPGSAVFDSALVMRDQPLVWDVPHTGLVTRESAPR